MPLCSEIFSLNYQEIRVFKLILAVAYEAQSWRVGGESVFYLALVFSLHSLRKPPAWIHKECLSWKRKRN
jgi:hypothetical protein